MSLLLDLRKMHESDNQIEQTLGVEEIPVEPADDYSVASAVETRLKIFKDGDTYRLFGRLGATLRLSCCRCLEPFDVAVDLPIDLMYLPQRENIGEGELEIAEEDLATAFYRDKQIDLGLILREQFQLSLPMKPLCREDCHGLCPECGNNRNSEQCSCNTSWRDPRFAALETLLANRRKD